MTTTDTTTALDLDAIRAQTDPLIANLTETVEQVKEHDHPAKGGDLYCLNLTSYMGDRMATVLRLLAAERAEVDRLRAELDRERRAHVCTERCEPNAHVAFQGRRRVTELERLVAELTTEVDRYRPIVEAARYSYGAGPCMDGECDHASEDDDNATEATPCPLVETGYATADDAIERDELRAEVKRLRAENDQQRIELDRYQAGLDVMARKAGGRRHDQ